MKTSRPDEEAARECTPSTEVAPYLQGRLSAAEQARFERHLSECEACRRATEAVRAVVQKLENLPPSSMRDLAPDVLSRLPPGAWADGSRKPGIRRLAPLLLRLAAGILIATGLAAGLVLARRTAAPEVAAQKPDSAGSDPRTAVLKGLDWLRSAQEPDGHWDPVKWGAPRQYEVGITALALLALRSAPGRATRAGQDATLAAGLAYLRRQQDTRGAFGPAFSGTPYNHALATLALMRVEAAERTGEWTNRCQQAVDLICASQTTPGGWGYGFGTGGAVNASVTVWQLQALMAASAAGFSGLDESLQRGIGWLVNDVSDQGWMGYTRSGDYPYGYETMTAAGLLCLLRSSAPGRADGTAAKMLGALLNASATNSEARDYCRSYFVVRALDLARGDESKRLAARIRAGLAASQNTSGREAGSWSPVDRWGAEGGRVYATALSVLALNDRPK